MSAPTANIRLLSKAEVCDRVCRTFPTVWLWVKQGRFPEPRILGSAPFWIESEIDKFLANLPVRKYGVPEVPIRRYPPARVAVKPRPAPAKVGT